MAYLALYRKYRPKQFYDVIGQDHITITLQNQAKAGAIAHAYLFSGTRGTGKTSTAQIFARTANCLNPIEGEACGECYCCQDAESPDIFEIDAASNNGVDEIRELRENIRFAPLKSRYKVYIIDEVHMLSAGAFNALLKTLEEPPSHAVFILATTEPQKLPATILSRCQRFEFHRIPVKLIMDRLQVILDQENVKIETQALQRIAFASEGGMRDALSMTDQCIAYCGNTVSYEEALKVLGMAGHDALFQIAQSIIDSDASTSLKQLDGICRKGSDLSVLSRDLIMHFRSLMLIHATKGQQAQELLECTDDTYQQYCTQASKCPSARAIRAVDQLSRAGLEMKRFDLPRVILESCIINLCLPESDTSNLALLDRVQQLENKIANWQPEKKQTDNQLSARAESEQMSKIETPLPKEMQQEPIPSSLDSSTAEQAFAFLISTQTQAIRQLLTHHAWQPRIVNQTLELIAPKTFLPQLLPTLKQREKEFTASIQAQYPELSVKFADTPGSSRNPASEPPASAATGSLFQAAQDFFGAENVIRKEDH